METNTFQTASLPSIIHFESSDQVTRWKCSHCNLCFKSRTLLNLHLGIENETVKSKSNNPYLKIQDKRFPCYLCNKIFDTDQGLKQHKGKKHNQNRRSICTFCGKTFLHKYAVKFHISQVHQKNTRVNCKYCHDVFYNVYAMKKHIRKCKYRFPGYTLDKDMMSNLS